MTHGDQPVEDIMIKAGMADPFLATATPKQMGEAAGAMSRQQIPALRTEFDEAAVADRRAHPVRPKFYDALLPAKDYEGVFSRAVDRGAAGLQRDYSAAAQFLGQQLGVDALAKYGAKGVSHAMVTAALNPAEIKIVRRHRRARETRPVGRRKNGRELTQYGGARRRRRRGCARQPHALGRHGQEIS